MTLNFTEIPYERPNLKEYEQSFLAVLQQFEKASSLTEQNQAIAEIQQLRVHMESLESVVHIRHTIDTNDEYYKEEQDFFDTVSPILQGLNTKFYRTLLASKNRQELEKEWGTQLFRLAEVRLKTFSDEVTEDLQKENALVTAYAKRLASASILFAGVERNLSQLQPFMQDENREIRRKAHEAKWDFFAEHAEEFDRIFDELVQIRTKIAQKLGYQNFVELGYARMDRTDYDAKMVTTYRDQVEKYIVPIATRLMERQKRRLDLNELYYYDESFKFKTGNPNPHGDADWIVRNGQKMYADLSEQTNEFFTFMQEYHLMDLVSKKGKRVGGYCTSIPEYKYPYIFSNFNGTAGDITVLTHEAGHAFQYYMSRNYAVPEYFFPTSESAEIHSMSMEFFTWPWMDLFFEEETEKFKFMHLSSALLFIPYGVAVDEFQHFVYENPSATPTERKVAWREIEQKYLPHRNYAENDFLENGGYWQQQLHIYHYPFYYIDYTLAQICAFQFWKKDRENHEQAWQDYLHLCELGGSQSFLQLVQAGALISPFTEGCLKEVTEEIDSWLNQVDDTQF